MEMFLFVSVLVLNILPVRVSAFNSSEHYIEVNHNTNDNYSLCNVRNPCIRKCCPENHISKNRMCVFSEEPAFNIKVYRGTNDESDNSNISLNIIHDDKCYQHRLALIPDFDEKQTFFLQYDGSLFKPHDRIRKYIPFNQYCLETIILGETSQHFAALVCYNETNLVEETDKNHSIGMIISMPFLLATFLVYLILPESNLHRKALMNYVMTLLLAYIFLVTVQLHPDSLQQDICSALGYTILLLFLVSFFWMNVMCVDMWFAFSGMRGFNGRRIAERKRFLMYSAYAYGVPILHILIVFIINTYADQKASYYPGIGIAKCFLDEGLPNLLYFYGPVALLITINIVLFILTAVKIQRVKKETSMLKQSDSRRHSYEDDKQKFNLYVKLMFAMGINWVMEIISWAVQWKMENSTPYSMWYLTDFCNATYGVFIFFIFVFKKKIWHSLKRRYYGFIGRPYLAHTMSVTQTTRSSNYSTTETGLSDHRMNELKNVRGEERILARH